MSIDLKMFDRYIFMKVQILNGRKLASVYTLMSRNRTIEYSSGQINVEVLKLVEYTGSNTSGVTSILTRPARNR